MSDQPPRINTTMGYNDHFKIRVMTDGTSTFAEVVDPGAGMFGEDVVRGTGIARRRKGDQRKEAIGTSLAVGRALRDSVERIERGLSQEGYSL